MSDTTTTDFQVQGKCPYCSTETNSVYHFGGRCSEVKAIEYFPDGRVKRVEFFAFGDKVQPKLPPDWSNPTITWGQDSNSCNGDDFRGWQITTWK